MQYLESFDLKVFSLIIYESTLWCGVTAPGVMCAANQVIPIEVQGISLGLMTVWEELMAQGVAKGH